MEKPIITREVMAPIIREASHIRDPMERIRRINSEANKVILQELDMPEEHKELAGDFYEHLHEADALQKKLEKEKSVDRKETLALLERHISLFELMKQHSKEVTTGYVEAFREILEELREKKQEQITHAVLTEPNTGKTYLEAVIHGASHSVEKLIPKEQVERYTREHEQTAIISSQSEAARRLSGSQS